MSREIRRVPSDWEHPRYNDYDGHAHQVGKYKTLHDSDYKSAAENWIADAAIAGFRIEHALTDVGKNIHEDSIKRQAEREGTPVTPIFATLQELEDYLVETGEQFGAYNQKYSRAGAHAFCEAGETVCSMEIRDGIARNGIEALVK